MKHLLMKKPESPCPCVSGGHLTGNHRAIARNQTELDFLNGVPRTVNVTTETLGKTKVAYCTGKVLKACQRVEGTRLPTQCPVWRVASLSTERSSTATVRVQTDV